MNRILLLAAWTALIPVSAMAEGHTLGDADKGERVFRKCKACHAVGEGAENKAGPQLNGVLGRVVATEPEFAYSSALTGLGGDGKVWTVEELSSFLEKPRDYVKGTKMAFAGLRKDSDRADVISYLATFSE